MIKEELKLSNKQLYPMFNEFLPKLNKFLGGENIYSIAISLLNAINVDFIIVHTEEYIELPVEFYPYLSPSKNSDFSEELSNFVKENTTVYVSSFDIEKSPTVSINLNLNLNNPESTKFLDDNFGNWECANHFAFLYFLNVLEILTKSNISLGDSEYISSLTKYFQQTCNGSIKPYSNEINSALVANLKLENSTNIEIKSIEEFINNENLSKLAENKIIFDTSDMSLLECIEHSFLINKLTSIEDSLYLRELFIKNIDNDFFLGLAFFHIYVDNVEFNNGNKLLNDCFFLFLHNSLNVSDAATYNERFPNPSAELLQISATLKNFPYQEATFSAVMPYIQ